MDIGNKESHKEEKMEESDKTIIFYITDKGLNLAEKLKNLFVDAQIFRFNTEKVAQLWYESNSLIFIMATGIVVRAISPLIRDKRTDPAVVVLDEKGKYAISLLSGHLGGANRLAREISDFLKGQAVITTASDINCLPSIDIWAKEKGLIIENWAELPKVSTIFLNRGALNVYVENGLFVELPDGFVEIKDPSSADVLITNRLFDSTKPSLLLRPKNLILGLGCNRGTSVEEIENNVKTVFKDNNLSLMSIDSIATINLKGDEKGIREFAEKYKLKILTYTPEELNEVVNLNPSDFCISKTVLKATGAKGVAEPAAKLASEGGKLLVPKQKIGNTTIAVAEKGLKINEASAKKEGKIYIVGIGPGNLRHLTPYARDAIGKSDVIVGYGTYLDLIRELIKDKEIVSTGMTQEIDRCKRAVEIALSGKTVSVISGGDPGIYAMAGLVLEVIRLEMNRLRDLEAQISGPSNFCTSHLSVEVIPGISALNACAARLGAPLMHDFAVISLSDRLTDWDIIERRLIAAATSDFVTVIYNPKSTTRTQHIEKAREIFLKYKSPDTPVGIVKAAMRENESIVLTNLRDMLHYDIDMQTTVIIGNSKTFVWDKWMITPRGYEKKLTSSEQKSP